MAASTACALLGELPLDVRIREQTDGGRPTVVAEPAQPRAARPTWTWRAARPRRLAAASAAAPGFPKIAVEDT